MNVKYALSNSFNLFPRYTFTYLASFLKKKPSGEKILIIKPDAIGDQILFAHTLGKLRRIFATNELTLLVQKSVSGFYKNCPHLNRIFEIDKHRFIHDAGYCLGMISRIRDERFSTVIHPVCSREPIGDQIAVSSGAVKVIGMTGDTSNQPAFLKYIYDARYTELIQGALPDDGFEGHKYITLLNHLQSAYDQKDWKPEAWLGEDDRLEAVKTIDNLGLQKKRFAVIAPGAGDPIRYWDSKKFAIIANRLVNQTRLAVVFVGTQAESQLVNDVMAEMEVPSFSIAGMTSITVLAAISEQAAIVIGTESAPIHLSLAVGTPAVCIMGGGHYGRFLPYPGDWPLKCVTHRMECFGCNWQCVHPEPYCINRVRAEETWEAVSDLLVQTRSGG